jgi:hypothetical protein
VGDGQGSAEDDAAARGGHRQSEQADEREVRERGEHGGGEAAERRAGEAAKGPRRVKRRHYRTAQDRDEIHG